MTLRSLSEVLPTLKGPHVSGSVTATVSLPPTSALSRLALLHWSRRAAIDIDDSRQRLQPGVAALALTATQAKLAHASQHHHHHGHHHNHGHHHHHSRHGATDSATSASTSLSPRRSPRDSAGTSRSVPGQLAASPRSDQVSSPNPDNAVAVLLLRPASLLLRAQLVGVPLTAMFVTTVRRLLALCLPGTDTTWDGVTAAADDWPTCHVLFDTYPPELCTVVKETCRDVQAAVAESSALRFDVDDAESTTMWANCVSPALSDDARTMLCHAALGCGVLDGVVAAALLSSLDKQGLPRDDVPPAVGVLVFALASLFAPLRGHAGDVDSLSSQSSASQSTSAASVSTTAEQSRWHAVLMEQHRGRLLRSLVHLVSGQVRGVANRLGQRYDASTVAAPLTATAAAADGQTASSHAPLVCDVPPKCAWSAGLAAATVPLVQYLFSHSASGVAHFPVLHNHRRAGDDDSSGGGGVTKLLAEAVDGAGTAAAPVAAVLRRLGGYAGVYMAAGQSESSAASARVTYPGTIAQAVDAVAAHGMAASVERVVASSSDFAVPFLRPVSYFEDISALARALAILTAVDVASSVRCGQTLAAAPWRVVAV